MDTNTDAIDGLPLPASGSDPTPNASLYARIAEMLAAYGDEGDRAVVVDYGSHWSDEAAAFNGLDPRAVQVIRVPDAATGDRVADAFGSLNGPGRPKVWVYTMYDFEPAAPAVVEAVHPRYAIALAA